MLRTQKKKSKIFYNAEYFLLYILLVYLYLSQIFQGSLGHIKI